MQITIGIGMLPSGYSLLGLPFPPRASSIGSQLTLIAMLILSVLIIVEQVRRPRVARVLLTLLALVGVLMVVASEQLAATIVLPATSRFPIWVAALIVGALIVALWHGRVLWARSPGLAVGE